MDAESRSVEILITPERCAGCLMCQMRCSYRFTKTFNPSQSRVEVLRRPEGKREFTVELREGCDRCGICATHCTYGALTRGRLQ